MTLPALVLAAGFGSRLSGYAEVPKPLVFFGGQRLIEWNLHWLHAAGVQRVWVNLHHRPDAFRATLGDGSRYGLALAYSEEEVILGTAGGWRRLQREWTGASLVVYGDNVARFDLRTLLERHASFRAHGALCTVALFDPATHVNTGIAGGRVRLEEDGRVVEFYEGDGRTEGLVNTGVYVLEPELADRIPAGRQDFGHDVFPDLAVAGLLRGYVIEETGFCLGLDTPESFHTAERLAAEGRVRL